MCDRRLCLTRLAEISGEFVIHNSNSPTGRAQTVVKDGAALRRLYFSTAALRHLDFFVQH